MRKSIRTALIVLLCLAVLGGGVYGVLCLLKGRSGPVKVYNASNFIMSGYTDEAETEGMVTTDRIQSVYLSGSQLVTEIFVEEGQTVHVGDPLVAFDTTLSDLELKRKDIEIRQLELRLERAQKLRGEMDSYAVGSGGGNYTEPEEESEVPESAPYLPYYTGGEGTQESPWIWLWNDDCAYDTEFLTELCPLYKDPMPEPGEEPEEEPAQEPEEESEEESEATSEPEDPRFNETWAVFEEREYDSPEGALLRAWLLHLWRDEYNALFFEVLEPSADYYLQDGEDEIFTDLSFDFTMTYTATELRKMKADADRQIEDMELKLRQAQLAYDTIEYELSNGVVTAKIDGVVKTLRDPDEALAANEPMLLVSGGGGYYVEARMSELELGVLQLGDSITVVSWESGETMTGTVTAISEYPNENGWYWSQGNSNVSHYPFTIFLDEDCNLRENEYVSVRFSAGADGQNEALYLENPFIRTENGRSYIYVQGADGRLEKRYVKTGRDLWGSYTEVLEGLSEDDNIAFPYGKNLAEGALTEQAGIEELYGVYY